jgi:hypothetical protein
MRDALTKAVARRPAHPCAPEFCPSRCDRKRQFCCFSSTRPAVDKGYRHRKADPVLDGLPLGSDLMGNKRAEAIVMGRITHGRSPSIVCELIDSRLTHRHHDPEMRPRQRTFSNSKIENFSCVTYGHSRRLRGISEGHGFSPAAHAHWRGAYTNWIRCRSRMLSGARWCERASDP